MSQKIETKHLLVIPCDKLFLETAIEGNSALEKYLKVSVPEKWTEFGTRPFKYALQKIKADENEQGWWTYVSIHKKDNILIGSCGYKGKPDAAGVVEIGYEIIKPYRNQGLGMELANALVMNAFAAPSVKVIKAYTLAMDNASTRILTKNGFLKKGEIDDIANEKLWRWELKKSIAVSIDNKK